MAPRVPWLERTWALDFPADLYPPLIERLRGTPARLEELVGRVPEAQRAERVEGTWSVLENAGHLSDLEDLFTARLDDFLAGREVLRAWEPTNRATEEAHHGERDPAELLEAFRRRRMAFVARLERLAPEDFARTARHPRLEAEMRLVDLLLFEADHDDHHLARISELLRSFA